MADVCASAAPRRAANEARRPLPSRRPAPRADRRGGCGRSRPTAWRTDAARRRRGARACRARRSIVTSPTSRRCSPRSAREGFRTLRRGADRGVGAARARPRRLRGDGRSRTCGSPSTHPVALPGDVRRLRRVVRATTPSSSRRRRRRSACWSIRSSSSSARARPRATIPLLHGAVHLVGRRTASRCSPSTGSCAASTTRGEALTHYATERLRAAIAAG